MKKVALSLAVVAASGAYVWSQWGTPDPLGPAFAGNDIQTGSIQPRTLTSASSTVDPQVVPFVTRETTPVSPPQQQTATANPAPADAPLPPLPAPNGTPATVATPTPPASTDTQLAEAFPSATAPAAPADPAPAQQQPDPAVVNGIPLPRLRPPYNPSTTADTATAAPPAAAAPAPVRVASNTGMNDGTYVGPVVNAYYGLMQIEAVVQGGRLNTIHVLRYPTDRRTSRYINSQALPMLRDEVLRAQSARVDIVSGATLSSEAFIRSLGAALNKAHS